MNSITTAIRTRGVPHEAAAPTLSFDRVTVQYVSGANGLTARASVGLPAAARPVANGGQLALDDVSFAVGQGERIAVVGPNGAGKSTLFKVIVGMLRPTRGEVSIFGHGPDGHICIGYVPQRTLIDWSFPVTVEDVVMMGRVGQIGLFRWPSRRDWEYVRASLERVNATHLMKKQIGELSGGQQQRVFIARALAQEAELLLLDEPLAGLDMPSQEMIFEILDRLRPDRATVLVATHDLNLAAERFDRVMLLNRRIIAFGEPADVLTTEHLLAAYGGHLHVMGDMADGLLFADSCCDHGEEL